jgi:transcription initiation factor TFIID subunit 3
MKKHSKTGVESRFQGTVLGVPAEPKMVKIEGGGAESSDEWCRATREKAAQAAEAKANKSRTTSHVVTREPSVDEDVVMETV